MTPAEVYLRLLAAVASHNNPAKSADALFKEFEARWKWDSYWKKWNPI